MLRAVSRIGVLFIVDAVCFVLARAMMRVVETGEFAGQAMA